MTPYMAELINTELSQGPAFPGAEKLPKSLLSPALTWGLRSLGLCQLEKNSMKIQEVLHGSKMVP